MAKTPEGKVKQDVVTLLKKYDAYYFFPVMGGYGRSGIPDIVACLRGAFIGLECKAGYNQATALQRRELDAIEHAGGITLVVREDTMDLLEQMLKEIKHGTRTLG